MNDSIHRALTELVYTEALYLDKQAWSSWLDLYQPDAVFWIPSWKAEHEMTDDPQTEVSFMYTRGKERLEERVRRVTGGKSIASLPLPRTLHCISNVLPSPMVEGGCAEWLVRSNCVTQIYDLKFERLRTTACAYEHSVVQQDGAWRIARKTIALVNDKVETVLDFYCV
jgi:3-phenylpropionate/cinnamic acid dioxygenase small subunit